MQFVTATLLARSANASDSLSKYHGETLKNMLQKIKSLPLRATLVLAILAVMMSGCAGSRESQLVGQWKMDSAAMSANMPKGKTPQEQMGMDMAKKMFENVTLDLKQDKTFAMNMMMEFSGDWKLDDSANTVTLNMTKMGTMDLSKMPNANKAAQKPMVLNISADNKTLTMSAPGGATPSPAGEMKFMKVK